MTLRIIEQRVKTSISLAIGVLVCVVLYSINKMLKKLNQETLPKVNILLDEATTVLSDSDDLIKKADDVMEEVESTIEDVDDTIKNVDSTITTVAGSIKTTAKQVEGSIGDVRDTIQTVTTASKSVNRGVDQMKSVSKVAKIAESSDIASTVNGFLKKVF